MTKHHSQAINTMTTARFNMRLDDNANDLWALRSRQTMQVL